MTTSAPTPFLERIRLRGNPVADPAATVDSTGAVVLTYAHHDGAEWRVRTATWTPAGWTAHAALSSGRAVARSMQLVAVFE